MLLIPFWLPPYSVADGVGNHEESITSVRGANGGCWDAIPACIEPHLGQIPEYTVESSASERGNVLHEDVARSKLANDACKFSPEPRLFPFFDPFAFAGERDILTWESTADEVDVFEVVSSDGVDVFMPRDLGPVLRKHLPGIRIDLHLPSTLHSCALQAKIETADPGEK